MSNYPPGVTGLEPEITGEWPCRACGGAGGYKDDDGAVSCYWCKGTGIEPEEVEPHQLWSLAMYVGPKEARAYVVDMIVEWLNRHDPETRQYIRKCIAAVSERRY